MGCVILKFFACGAAGEVHDMIDIKHIRSTLVQFSMFRPTSNVRQYQSVAINNIQCQYNYSTYTTYTNLVDLVLEI